MPTISKITPQAKNPNRVNVYVDGEFYAGVDQAVAWRLGLKPGLPLTDELTGELVGQEEYEKLWDYALRCLKMSAQSVRAIRGKLARKAHDPDLVDQIMIRLVEAGLLDDIRLAEGLVSKYTSLATKSPKEIRLVLMRKGLDKQTIEEAMKGTSDGLSEAAIVKLAEAKLRSLREVEPRVKFEKIAAYLSRKGFKYGQVKQILDRLLAVSPD